MDAITFRSIFPEFSSAGAFSDSAISFWLNLGTSRLDVSVWGDQLDYGLALFTAHNLAIGSKNQVAASRGNAPGELTGATASKSVENVSVSYDTSFVKMNDVGYWGLTSYGLQFIQLARLMGSGGYFV
jgi:hypothetical protein